MFYERQKRRLNLEWLANTNLDYLQMEEIYLCLKYDVDPSSISDPDIPAESMRSLREHLFEMQGVYEDERIKINKQKTKLTILIVGFVLVLFSRRQLYILTGIIYHCTLKILT